MRYIQSAFHDEKSIQVGNNETFFDNLWVLSSYTSIEIQMFILTVDQLPVKRHVLLGLSQRLASVKLKHRITDDIHGDILAWGIRGVLREWSAECDGKCNTDGKS